MNADDDISQLRYMGISHSDDSVLDGCPTQSVYALFIFRIHPKHAHDIFADDIAPYSKQKEARVIRTFFQQHSFWNVTSDTFLILARAHR